MDHKHKPFLVVGAGSIGERHIRNLWALGYTNIHVLRTRGNPFRDIAGASVQQHFSWDDIDSLKPYAAIICTPTSLHSEHALKCAEAGSHLLIEKPLSHDANGLDELRKAVVANNLYLRVAYMMRFHPLLIKVKEMIANQALGQLISFSSKWGEYLPDWHPWEDYRTSYAARRDLGGGAALTLSHDIDLSHWMCGSEPDSFAVFKNYQTPLGIEAESSADILIRYKNGIISNLQLNFCERVPERWTRLVFDDGTLLFDYYDKSLTIKRKDGTEVLRVPEFDRNDLYISQLRHFIGKTNDFSTADSTEQIENSRSVITICTAG